MCVLQSAVKENKVVCARMLLDAGAKTYAGPESLLAIACRDGYRQMAEMLIQYGCNESQDKEGTPLLMLLTSHPALFEMLLCKYGFDPTEVDSSGGSPLHLAAAIGSTHLVKLLLDRGVDVNCRNDKGETPLHAATDGHIGGEEHGENPPHLRAVEMLLNAGAEIDPIDCLGRTPLMCAVWYNNSAAVELLCKRGANANTVRYDSYFPLYVASQNGNDEVVHTLLNAGAIHNMREAAESCSTALMIAAQNNNASVCQVLLSWADNDKEFLNLQDKDGITALAGAASSGRLKIIKLLLGAGAHANIEDFYGETPVHRAAKWNYPEVIKVLLIHGADKSIKNLQGESPLMLAAANGHAECVRVLMGTGEDWATDDVNKVDG